MSLLVLISEHKNTNHRILMVGKRVISLQFFL
nr:MAG TPA: hypothetical protein [Caudoviricetes sp.]